MASEITAVTGLSVTKGNLVASHATKTMKYDMTGTHRCSSTQDVGTSHEALVIPAEVATPGWCHMKNLDATNYVEVGVLVSSTFYPLLKLKPTEEIVFRLGTSSPYAKANTATVKLDYSIYED